MPQTCPHCGITLPAVVDAFCPECREDLSVTPEEAAAKRTADSSRTGVAGRLLTAPQAAVAAGVLGVVALIALVIAIADRDWEGAALYGFGACVCAVRASWRYWNPHRVHGTARERKA